MLNMVGSIAFGASAVGAFVITGTDELRNAELANIGTFIGALCFFAGAVLLIPEEAREPEGPAAAAADSAQR
jgi:predicted cobalt transporter CbtA